MILNARARPGVSVTIVKPTRRAYYNNFITFKYLTSQM